MSKQSLSQLNLRLPSDLKAWVREEAAKNQRTATAEAIFIFQMYRQAKESKNVFARQP